MSDAERILTELLRERDGMLRPRGWLHERETRAERAILLEALKRIREHEKEAG